MLIIVYISGDCLTSVSCHYEVLRANLEMRCSTSVHIINGTEIAFLVDSANALLSLCL